MRRDDGQGAGRWFAGATVMLVAISVSASMTACGKSSESSRESAPAAAAPSADTSQAAATPARVFFVQPQDGATVKSPVHFEFGADQFTIAAVPAGTVEAPRPAVGHYHLGVDQGCMPAGQVIPPGTPAWVHFGKGNNTIDMQLTPGPHKFAVQAGDDQHRTVEGLCQTISITVTE